MKDACVSCDCETLYDKEYHIDQRLGYIEGVGQLCLDCWEKIYGGHQTGINLILKTLGVI
ncbi:MAG: hypothetical protein H8E03_00310 [Pelagibacteraceae bacterium]|nr:hypothetical protein [Pelagibacteraceae bacterium]